MRMQITDDEFMRLLALAPVEEVLGSPEMEALYDKAQKEYETMTPTDHISVWEHARNYHLERIQKRIDELLNKIPRDNFCTDDNNCGGALTAKETNELEYLFRMKTDLISLPLTDDTFPAPSF